MGHNHFRDIYNQERESMEDLVRAVCHPCQIAIWGQRDQVIVPCPQCGREVETDRDVVEGFLRELGLNR